MLKINKHNLQKVISECYYYSSNQYFKSLANADLQKEWFCRGYFCALKTISGFFNLKMDNDSFIIQ